MDCFVWTHISQQISIFNVKLRCIVLAERRVPTYLISLTITSFSPNYTVVSSSSFLVSFSLDWHTRNLVIVVKGSLWWTHDKIMHASTCLVVLPHVKRGAFFFLTSHDDYTTLLILCTTKGSFVFALTPGYANFILLLRLLIFYIIYIASPFAYSFSKEHT